MRVRIRFVERRDPGRRKFHQHLMAVNGRFRDSKRRDLLAEADRFGIGEGKAIVGEVSAAVAQWPTHARTAGVDERVVTRIGNLHL